MAFGIDNPNPDTERANRNAMEAIVHLANTFHGGNWRIEQVTRVDPDYSWVTLSLDGIKVEIEITTNVKTFAQRMLSDFPSLAGRSPQPKV